jgi:VIT1/CCC1 family predicted Fe2+/Mn2+ transporter
VDDLDYFPGGTWLSDDDAAYQGYADPGTAWRGDRHYRGGEPDNVWQRQADGPWSPLGAPVAGQVRESGAQPRYREGGWPDVPLGGEPGRPSAASWDTQPHTRPYPSAPPPAGYPRAYGPAPRDSGPQERLRDSGPRDRLRDSGPRERLRETGARDRLRDSGPQDFGPRRPAEPGDGRSARRHTGTSLIAGYAPDADYDDEPRGTASRAASRAPSSAGAPQASYGRPLPDWLPFGHRLVLLPKEQGAPALGNLREHRDISGGWLRPAVFGAMDGVVTNASLIAGIGAGGGAHGMIILTGIAGLIAGAFSMATGEYISVKSQNELTQAEVELERLQHERDRDGKLDRLTQVFMDKGVSPNLAEAVSRQISADPERAVATHVREELGLDPDDLPSPRTAAVASFISFTIGALVPLGPFLLGYPSLQAALVLAGLFAFGGGAVVARLAGRPAFLGGLRQFTAAFLATGMAFFIGHLVGAHLG